MGWLHGREEDSVPSLRGAVEADLTKLRAADIVAKIRHEAAAARPVPECAKDWPELLQWAVRANVCPEHGVEGEPCPGFQVWDDDTQSHVALWVIAELNGVAAPDEIAATKPEPEVRISLELILKETFQVKSPDERWFRALEAALEGATAPTPELEQVKERLLRFGSVYKRKGLVGEFLRWVVSLVQKED